MQCFTCFPDAQRGNPHVAHGMHLDNPAKLKDTGYIEHHPARSCSPVSSCSEDGQFAGSSGSGSSDGGGYAADASSWRVRNQVLISQQDKPGKVSCSNLYEANLDHCRDLVMHMFLVQFDNVRMQP
jgi:hypothetical protein